MKKNNKFGFTLVELLAVIVILAIILVIAVPQIISTIDESRNGAFVSSAKLIASSAETLKLTNDTLGITEDIDCPDVSEYNSDDYQSCSIKFDDNGNAQVTLVGKGKFSGKYVCNGTRTEAVVTEESCTLVTLTVNLDGGTDTVDYEAKYEAGSTVTLTEPTKEGYTFVSWTVIGTGAKVEGNKLTMGTENTTVTATWEEERNFSTDSWETIVAAVKQAETNGTEYPYNVGDEKPIDLGTTLGTHTIRIANKKKCSAVSVTSKTACGFVLEFKDVISTHAMNGTDSSSSTNAGGWPASEMRKYLNDIDASVNTDGVIYNAIPDALRNGIIDTYVISSKGSETITGYENVVNGNFYSTDKLYLLSPEEIYGTSFTNSYDTSRGTSRQLDYYEGKSVTTSIYGDGDAIKYSVSTESTWWLRSARSDFSGNFYYVNNNGAGTSSYSYYSNGVSPAFRLAE